MKSEYGYSLIEVLVAGVILAVTVIAVTSMLRAGVDLDSDADLRRQAVDKLSSAMEISERNPRDVIGWNGLSSDIQISTLRQSATSTIPCTLSVSVGNGTRNVQSQSVPYKSLAYQMKWKDQVLEDTVLLVKLTFN